MSEHKAKIEWKRTSPDFDYETYNRDHSWSFDGGIKVRAAAAPEFKGPQDCVDPEEALVAATAGCHMLTFLAIASKKKLTVEKYEDNAVGFLEKNEEGKLAVTRITLSPKVTFASGVSVDKGKLEALHASAHEHCFIANSIKASVKVNL